MNTAYFTFNTLPQPASQGNQTDQAQLLQAILRLNAADFRHMQAISSAYATHLTLAEAQLQTGNSSLQLIKEALHERYLKDLQQLLTGAQFALVLPLLQPVPGSEPWPNPSYLPR